MSAWRTLRSRGPVSTAVFCQVVYYFTDSEGTSENLHRSPPVRALNFVYHSKRSNSSCIRIIIHLCISITLELSLDSTEALIANHVIKTRVSWQPASNTTVSTRYPPTRHDVTKDSSKTQSSPLNLKSQQIGI
ncbi:hypothetical protein PoB_001577400 [Plakobranchus ocellatus]|uniref:Uncharacterized protein n=1 Tax=Plakobranchus ocellatus TaxID=259542 RepID=A0AAV3Z4G3_9GAST|nr:hypothetical protein PoB_001577400 [Plakobranchus ocellatus]